MSTYSLSHLADSTLLRDLAALVTRDRTTTAHLLAHLAEVDARKLYLPAAYPSMYAYCIGELHLSEDGASKRIQAARVARRFPAIFEAVAEGRLHLSAVVLLAPYLTEHTADELLAAATHKTKSEIELLVAQRFPRPDVLAWVEAIPTTEQHAPGHVEGGPPLVPEPVGEEPRHAPAHAGAPLLGQHAPGHVQPVLASGHAGDRARVKPLGSHSFAVQFTLSRNGHDQLRYAQALLGHQIPSGDLAQVFERALDALVGQLERRKFAATARPRPGQRRSPAPGHHIPAQVRRAVWERDGGQCTFVGETGRRCSARRVHALPAGAWPENCPRSGHDDSAGRSWGPSRGRCVRAGPGAGRGPMAPATRIPRRRNPPGGGALRRHPRRVARGPRASRHLELGARRPTQGTSGAPWPYCGAVPAEIPLRCRNIPRSKGASSPHTQPATISPITGENLKPWPEHGLATITCGAWGSRSIQKCSSGVLV